ncbi:MAG TPA: hypothetical protein VIT65_07635 [Microlunatus sp.]
MQEPPAELTDADVLVAVRDAWSEQAIGVEHLAVGFGAHHWRVETGGSPGLFVTFDRFGTRHSVGSLEAAYAGAIQLAGAGLEFVLAPLRTRSGAVLVQVATGALSCTPWVDGTVVGEGEIDDPGTAADNIADLARLHATAPPSGLPGWSPLAGADLAERLSGLLLATPWGTGPYGEPVRREIADRSTAIDAWIRRHRELAEAATGRSWVVTHGETHTRNQLRTPAGIRFVDWESLKLAPRERDLATLVQAGYGTQVGADPAMVELFDLEWRLAEIDEYAHRFAALHSGTDDDRTAYKGLLNELRRGAWWPPA